jgi:Protein of unknown function (DUF1566)
VGHVSCDPLGCVDTAQHQPEGTDCGEHAFCNEGECVLCLEDAFCEPAPCRTGISSCRTGEWECLETGASDDGTPCGDELVCRSGECVTCVANEPCQPVSDCEIGSFSCTTGQPACESVGVRTPGTVCEMMNLCSEGRCLDSDQAWWSVPAPTEARGENPVDYKADLTWDTSKSEVLGLEWGGASTELMDQASAIEYCAGYTVGSLREWRLPSAIELVTTYDEAEGGFDTSIPAEPGQYWTSSDVAEDLSLAWAYSSYRTLAAVARTEPLRVVCVRTDALTVSSGGFVVEEETVFDERTMLEWTRYDTGADVGRSTRFTTCEALDRDGGGWRVPTLLELFTIVDLGRTNPAIDPVAFPNTFGTRFWVATTCPGCDDVTYIDFYTGRISSADEGTGRLRCVRTPL